MGNGIRHLTAVPTAPAPTPEVDLSRAAELVADWLPFLLRAARREVTPCLDEVTDMYTDATELLTRLERIVPADSRPTLHEALEALARDHDRTVWGV